MNLMITITPKTKVFVFSANLPTFYSPTSRVPERGPKVGACGRVNEGNLGLAPQTYDTCGPDRIKEVTLGPFNEYRNEYISC